MAIIKQSILGPISGKLGEFIIRRRYGKIVVYQKPEQYNISFSNLAVQNRSKFANTVKLASLINSNSQLNSIWKSSKVKGVNTYQKILRCNSKFTSYSGLTDKSILAPNGLPLLNPAITIDKKIITVSANTSTPVNSNSSSSLLLFSNYKNHHLNLSLLSSQNVIIGNNRISGVFNLSKAQTSILQFKGKTMLFCIFTFAHQNNIPFTWTDTISFELRK